MARTPFSRELYNKHNSLGIKVALEMLNQYGYETIENGDVERYCARDCLVSKDGVDVSIEVERKAVWHRKDNWEGYSSVRVPYRKRNSGAELYIMINEPSTCLLITKMNEIKKSPTIKYTTQLHNIPEDFFSAPIEIFDVMVLEDGKWNFKTNKHNYLDQRQIPFAKSPLDMFRGSGKKIDV